MANFGEAVPHLPLLRDEAIAVKAVYRIAVCRGAPVLLRKDMGEAMSYDINIVKNVT